MIDFIKHNICKILFKHETYTKNYQMLFVFYT